MSFTNRSVWPLLVALAAGWANGTQPPEGDGVTLVAKRAGGDEAASPPGAGPERLAASIYLGQVYPSGTLYLEAFEGAGDPAGVPDAERLLFTPLDADVDLPPEWLGRWLEARWVGRSDHADPPRAEGMLSPDSPCAGGDYEPREGATYAARSAAAHAGIPWRVEEYFATVEAFTCGSEHGLLLYQADEPPPRSFRVLAVRPEVRIAELDRSVAGLPRPLTAEEEAALRERRAARDECTLEPRDVDGATQIVAFREADSGHRVRVSSYVSACTALSEHVLLDVLAGDSVLATFRIVRWRGNP
ncbi:MAG TPA: hypothetical protein VF192_07525 [Longimicrobiales bacterium]